MDIPFLEIPYYGRIDVDGEPFCMGCKEMDLRVTTNELYGEDRPVELFKLIRCSYIMKCRRLYERNLKSDENR